MSTVTNLAHFTKMFASDKPVWEIEEALKSALESEKTCETYVDILVEEYKAKGWLSEFVMYPYEDESDAFSSAFYDLAVKRCYVEMLRGCLEIAKSREDNTDKHAEEYFSAH